MFYRFYIDLEIPQTDLFDSSAIKMKRYVENKRGVHLICKNGFQIYNSPLEKKELLLYI